MTTTTNPWPTIDGWLQANAKKVLKKLRRPASNGGISRAEAALGRGLPPDLREGYLIHDGASGEDPTIFRACRVPKNALWVHYMWWLPVEEAVKKYAAQKALGIDWQDSWLPFAEDSAGNHLVMDLDDGEITAWDHESGEHVLLAADFNEWIGWLAEDMQAHLVGYSDDDEDAGSLELLETPFVPPPAPVAPEDKSARMYLDILVEKGFVALDPKAKTEALVRELSIALQAKGKAKRRAAVIKILEDNNAVEEVFAEDEQLGRLSDEFA